VEPIDGGAAAVTVPLAAAVDSLLTEVGDGALARLSDADVLAEVRELELLRRRLGSADHALVAELQTWAESDGIGRAWSRLVINH